VINEALEPLSDVLVGLSETTIENGLEGEHEARSQVKVSDSEIVTRNPGFAIKVGIQYLGQSFAFLESLSESFLVWWSKS